MPVFDPTPLCGWVPDVPSRPRVAAFFRPLSQVAPHWMILRVPEKIMLYKSWKDVINGYPSYPAQQIGDCTSFGSGHALDCLQVVEVAIEKQQLRYLESCTEAIYGLGREVAGMLGSGDGCYGAAVAKALVTMGDVPRSVVGDYSGSRAKSWGNTGVPVDVKQKCAEHKLGGCAAVTTCDELDAALAAGHPAIICSGQGFTMTRDSTGTCQPQGSWAHCLIPGTMVSTMVPKPCEDIREGDEVVTHLGRTRKVMKVHERRYDGDLISIRTTGAMTVRATSEHPYLVYRPMNTENWAKPGNQVVGTRSVAFQQAAKEDHETGQPTWMAAESVRPGDYLLVPAVLERSAIRVPGWEMNDRATNIPVPLSPNPDVAFLFGYYVANGNCREDHGITLTLPRNSSHALRLIFSLERLGMMPRTEQHETFERIIVDSVILSRSFSDWFGGSSATKHFPNFVFGSGWSLKELLEGYSAGDGCDIGGNRRRITTVSPVLAQQIWRIAVILGLAPMMHRIRADRPGAYSNALPSIGVEFGAPPIKKSARYWKDFYCVPVREVSRIHYRGPVYNYHVEDDESYLADGVIVHNCMSISGRRIGSKGQRQFLIMQSWGPNVPDGPLTDDQPDFSFWADESVISRMLGEQDSFAFSKFPGFEINPLPAHWTYDSMI